MRPRLPLPELPASFTVADARAAGIDYGRLRGGDLDSPFHGVRSAPNSPSEIPERRVHDRAELYSPRLKPGQFFSEATALAIWGLPLPAGEDSDVIHVAVLPPATAPRARGVRGHQYEVDRVFARDGLPVCSAVLAWRQCAARMSVDQLILVGDALLRRVRPFTTVEGLAHLVGSSAGHRGSQRLARALTEIRPRTDSPKETGTRLVITRGGLPEPDVNAPVRDHSGRALGLGDLVYEPWRVVIEYDGGYHFASDAQMYSDIDRLAAFAAAGWTVIRVHKFHLREPQVIVDRVSAALLAAGWSARS